MSIIWGTLAGAAMALPPLLAHVLPFSPGTALQYEEVRGIGLAALLLRLLVTTPVLIAFVEEVAFRGLLLGKLQRAWPARPRTALALSSLAFALWHVAANLRTLQQTNVLSADLLPLPLALAGGLLSVFVAGLVFGGLYQRTGSLAAPVLAHWLVDALVLLALYAPPNA
jgi:membrane protease YdiL (CAAX protease family)